MKKLLRALAFWLIGVYECFYCGAVCVRFGRFLDNSYPHADSQDVVYQCERCWLSTREKKAEG